MNNDSSFAPLNWHNGIIKSKEVITVYERCEANGMDIEELERLFQDGYHRGATETVGLRVG